MPPPRHKEEEIWKRIEALEGRTIHAASGARYRVLDVDAAARELRVLSVADQTVTEPIALLDLYTIYVLLYRSGRLELDFMAKHCRETLGWREWDARGAAIFAFLPQLDGLISGTETGVTVDLERAPRHQTVRRPMKPEPEVEAPAPEAESPVSAQEESIPAAAEAASALPRPVTTADAAIIWRHATELLESAIGADALAQRLAPTEVPKDRDLRFLYESLLLSIAMTPRFRHHVDDFERLAAALDGFDPAAVLKTSRGNWEQVRGALLKAQPAGARSHPSVRSTWERFARSAVSAAEYLQRFDNAEGLLTYVEDFHRSPSTCAALPLVLSHEIYGYGYAPAANFLQRIGYLNFCHPDQHAQDICVWLGLCARSDYAVAAQLAGLAQAASVTALALNTLFDLIGSRLATDPTEANARKRAFVRAVQQAVAADASRGTVTP